ncbi:MAG: uroporphyrinogen decarboxylase [Gammaproteobacteria bacterium]|nr:uroporphyrinogen decarboxylase [Gammaproteobacteria bacterium]
MVPLKNDRLLRAIRHQPVDKTPIWIMRQAGRYLPEYRAVRQKAGRFMTVCKTPELACQVTLQPLARFPLDAAILFSDILTIPDAMGLGLYFKEGEGPVFERPLRTERDIHTLAIPDPEMSLRYVLDAIRMIQYELAGAVPLIGFCGSPWTLASYMVEGSANKSFPVIHAMLQQQPKLLHCLLDKLAEAVSLHLNAQINAGVQVVMIFDTWGGMLNTEQYREYSLHYVQQIIANIAQENSSQSVPVILFTKGGGQWLEFMSKSGCDVIGVDWLVNLEKARQTVGDKIALQGNLNPAILYQSEDIIRAEVTRILKEYGSGSGHIFNLGHGIPQDVPPEHVAILVDAVHRLSEPYHYKI